MFDDSTESDSGHRVIARVLDEIEAGRLSLDAAIAAHPDLEPKIRELDSLRRLLWTAQEESEPARPDRIDEFEILGVVGRGGMGVVYRARHPRLEREVAVKTIKPTHVDERSRRRFQREQTALARLHQTHIVPIYAAGCDGAIEYFVMPYIEGASLHDILQTARKGGGSTKDGNGTRTLSSLAQAARDDNDKPDARPKDLSPTRPWTSPPPADAPTERPLASPALPGAHPRITGPSYFRSVAEAVASAAEALEHAHAKGVYHRDLKPHNVMIAEHGHVWLIDFGLAYLLGRADELADRASSADPSHEPLTRAAVGTWNYMAPEQFRQHADARTDVWGLGVTLYELLTLQRAFPQRALPELQRAIETLDPPPPSSLVPSLPRDLDAICRRAIAKSPNDRYQTAKAFAEDLRRFLRAEEVSARPRPLPERAWQWARLHKHWSLLILFLSVAVPLIIGLLVHVAQKAQRELAEERRQVIIRDVESILRAPKESGWSQRALAKLEEAAAIRKDSVVRDAAAAAFAGPTAERFANNDTFGASSVAYDVAGKRIVLGGLSKRLDPKLPLQPAHVWDLVENKITPGKASGPGLVAFRADGAPVQLAGASNGRVQLLHVLTGELLQQFQLPRKRETARPPTLALGRLGDRVAASFQPENETLVWIGADPNPRRLPVGASAIAFSRDGTLVGVGAPSGETSIWSAADGRRLTSFVATPLTVQNIAFSPRVSLNAEGLTGAVVTGGHGRCAVVSLPSGKAICHLDYDDFIPKSIGFSLDGALVAVNGVLFDAASGRRVVRLGSQDVFAFSPDGSEYCCAGGELFAGRQVARVAFDANRGLALLHGLSGSAARLAFSADARLVAALSRDWQIAVWDVRSGRLVQTLKAPEGPYADNGAIALDKTGGRLAAASGEVASMWDLPSGKRTDWKLPPGFSNELAFTSDGELLLARNELKSMVDFPLARIYPPSETHPRVIRGRNLLGPTPATPLYEIDAFSRHCFGLAITPDGCRLLGEGWSLRTGLDRSVVLFDARTGKEVRRYAVQNDLDNRSTGADSTGAVMMFRETLHPTAIRVIAAEDGRALDVVRQELILAHGPGGQTWVGHTEGLWSPGLFQRGRPDPLFRLTHFTADNPATFSPDGRYFAFQSADGPMALLDIPRMKQNLDQLGLGW